MEYFIFADCWNLQIHNVPIRLFMSCSVNYFAGVFKNLSMAAILNSLASVLIIGKKKLFDCWTRSQWVCMLLLYEKWEYYFIMLYITNTNPEERRVALSVVAHCKVVRLWPQDLHNVLIELGLFFLQRERRKDTEKERGFDMHCVKP